MTDPVPTRFNMARYCLDGRPAAKPCLIVAGAAEEERWTYGALKDAVLRVAHGFRAQGLRPGERLMIRMENDAAYVLAYFGALAAGLVALPSSAMLTEREAAFLLADSGASAVAIGESLRLGRAPDGVRIIPAAEIRRLAAGGPLAEFADTGGEDPAFLIYTSGTTDRPKGVLHGHRQAWGRRPMYRGWHGISEADTVLHAGAINWTYTLGVGLADPWASGATAVLYNGPRDPTVWPRLIARFGATIFAAVPGLYRQVLKYADLDPNRLASLRHGLAAGEPLPAALLQAWREAAGSDLYEALGMSEISTYVSQAPPGPARPGSPGRPQPGRRIAVLPVEGDPVPLPAGETGLLAVHCSDPGLMLGYWNRPGEETRAWRGAWFVGGDLAAFESDGFLRYHGRSDELMNAGGYRVSPLEVEAALADHPAVAEVAVAERRVRPEVSVIAAYIVPRDGAKIDKDALIAWSADRLAAYKCPKEVVPLERLPRSATGKLLRRRLQALGPRT